MSVAMQRDGAKVRRQIKESRESRRTARSAPAVDTPEAETTNDSAQDNMSMNSGNSFPLFDNNNNSRGPATQQVNGNGAPANGLNLTMPMNAGHQMDVNMLYQKVLELSEVLKENREKTHGIVAGAEELAVCLLRVSMIGSKFQVLIRLVQQTRAAANGASPSLQEANAEISSTHSIAHSVMHSSDISQLPGSPSWRNN